MTIVWFSAQHKVLAIASSPGCFFQLSPLARSIITAWGRCCDDHIICTYTISLHRDLSQYIRLVLHSELAVTGAVVSPLVEQ